MRFFSKWMVFTGFYLLFPLQAYATTFTGTPFRLLATEVFYYPGSSTSAFQCPSTTNAPATVMNTTNMTSAMTPIRGLAWYSCLVSLDFPLDSVTQSAFSNWIACNSIPTSSSSPSGMLCTFQYPQGEPPTTTFVVTNTALGAGHPFAFKEVHIFTTNGTSTPTNRSSSSSFSSSTTLSYPGTSGLSVTIPYSAAEEIGSANTGNIIVMTPAS